jgi:Cu+-exporting ATPase
MSMKYCSVNGVNQCIVNFGAELATVEYDPGRTNVKAIQEAVNKAGYSAFLLQQNLTNREDETEKRRESREARELTRKVAIAIILSAIIVIGFIPMMTGLNIPFIPMWLHNSWLQLILTIPILWCGLSL